MGWWHRLCEREINAPWTYRKRHLADNFFECFDNIRRVVTRYDKRADPFLGFVGLEAPRVSIMSWVGKLALEPVMQFGVDRA